jgi:hypothetical protein
MGIRTCLQSGEGGAQQKGGGHGAFVTIENGGAQSYKRHGMAS